MVIYCCNQKKIKKVFFNLKDAKLVLYHSHCIIIYLYAFVISFEFVVEIILSLKDTTLCKCYNIICINYIIYRQLQPSLKTSFPDSKQLNQYNLFIVSINLNTLNV